MMTVYFINTSVMAFFTPFKRTTLFIILIFVLVILLVILIFQQRIVQINHRLKQQQETVL